MAKRKDGLCPSLLQFYGKHQTPYLEKPGHIVKTYQTNSNLLRQIRVPNGLSRAAVELQTIIEVIHRTLRALSSSSSRNSDDPSEQKKKQLIASVQFNPEGCIWKLAFHSSLGHRADESHCMEFVCCANSALSGEETKVATAAETKNSDDQSYCSSDDGNIDDNGFVPTNYLIKSTLILIVPPLALELLDDKCCPPPPTTLAPPVLDGYKEAKAAFEFVTVAVRKSVVRLEFPDFPHGGKTALFREIYQLNARVRTVADAGC